MKKKNNNPFKMWGSYIGAIALWLSLNISLAWFNFFYATLWQRVLHLPPFTYSAILLTVIIGFLLGWLVEYLIKK